MIARLRRWVHRRIAGPPTMPLSVLKQRIPPHRADRPPVRMEPWMGPR